MQRIAWLWGVVGAVIGAVLTLLYLLIVGERPLDVGPFAVGATTIIALLVGHWLSRSSELEVWLRARRFDALAEFVETTYLRTITRGATTEEWQAANLRTIAAMARVELLAHPDLARLSTALNLASYEYANLQKSNRTANEEELAKDKFFHYWHEFVAEARKHINVSGRAT